MLFLVHHQDEFLFDDNQMSDQVRRKDLLPLICPTIHLFLAVGICHGWLIYSYTLTNINLFWSYCVTAFVVVCQGSPSIASQSGAMGTTNRRSLVL